jgi:hypothetical protein
MRVLFFYTGGIPTVSLVTLGVLDWSPPQCLWVPGVLWILLGRNDGSTKDRQCQGLLKADDDDGGNSF